MQVLQQKCIVVYGQGDQVRLLNKFCACSMDSRELLLYQRSLDDQKLGSLFWFLSIENVHIQSSERSKTYKCYRSRKCIRWHIPVHAIFAVFMYFSFLFYVGHLSLLGLQRPEDRATLLLSACSCPITWRHL